MAEANYQAYEHRCQRAAVVGQIFAWRVTERLGYRAIAERLSQDPDRYPPPVSPDPARSRAPR